MKKTPLYKLDLDVYEETLENGLKIFVIPKSDANNIYATFSTDYGSRQNEFKLINTNQMIKVPDGIAHFLEHKLFEQKDQIDPFTFYSNSGTDCNANTSQYKTTYLFTGQNNFEENLNFLLDFVQEPYFTDENVLKEKGIIEQEIKMYKDDPIQTAYENILFNSFVNDPIRIPIAGTIDSIYKITKEDLYNCYNTFYHPSNMFVVITGNVEPKKTIEIIKKNQKKKNYEKVNDIVIKQYDEPDNVYKEKEVIIGNVTIPKVLMSYKFNIKDIDLDIKTIVNYIGIFVDMKIGPTSLFLEKLKEDKIVTDDIGFSIVKTNTHVLLVLEAETNFEDELIEKIDNEIKDLNFEENEFNRKKKTAISSCIYMSDNIYRLNSLVMNDLIDNKKFNPDIYKHYKNLNFEDFNKLINKLEFKNKSIYIVKSK